MAPGHPEGNLHPWGENVAQRYSPLPSMCVTLVRFPERTHRKIMGNSVLPSSLVWHLGGGRWFTQAKNNWDLRNATSLKCRAAVCALLGYKWEFTGHLDTTYACDLLLGQRSGPGRVRLSLFLGPSQSPIMVLTKVTGSASELSSVAVDRFTSF